jgi:16S rRNA G1207 methylase RsmC
VCATKKRHVEPEMVDGLNADDVGVRMLAEAVAGAEAAGLLLVCSGDLPRASRPESTRLVLDVRETSTSVARPILVGPGLVADLTRRFEHAVVWPRAHLGKDFTQQCLARAALALVEGGQLWCAVRKDKGADTVGRFMAALLGNVETQRRERRYRLLRSERRAHVDADLASQTLDVRYRLEDPLLDGLVVRACPGVFSRRELDAGTRQLIEHAAALSLRPTRVLDLCCGVGPLALWAAHRWPVDVVAVDSNAIAVAMCTENAMASGLVDRVQVCLHDGLPAPVEPVDLALVNPPTHAPPAVLERLLAGLRLWLRPGGLALAVASRPGRVIDAFESAGARTRAHARASYTIVEAGW